MGRRIRLQYPIVVLIALLLAPCTAIYADIVRLKSLREDIEVKITELTQDSIGVVISKRHIKSLAIQPGNRQVYPDLVSFFTSGVKLECKVTTVNTDSIGIRIPKSEVVSLQMVFAPEAAKRGKQVRAASASGGQRTPTFSRSKKKTEPFAGHAEGVEKHAPPPARRPLALKEEIRKETEMYAVEPPISREVAKQKIKRDVMQELEAEEARYGESASGATWPSPQALKDEIKKELKEEIEAKHEAEEKIFQETSLGRVEGKMLRRGQPLPYCEVKIVMLVRTKIPLTTSFKQPDLPTEYGGVTDDEGRYHLMNVAPGDYKIYWKPPTESSWIRRLAMKPDITVEGGRTTYPKDLETFKRVIN